MSGLSDYMENIILDFLLGNNSYTVPATLYMALFTADPTDSGSIVNEVSGNGYARVAVTNNSTNFPNAVSGSKSNGTDIVFPTATGDWGTITHIGIFDASSGGNMIMSKELGLHKTVQLADTPRFVASDLTITID